MSAAHWEQQVRGWGVLVHGGAGSVDTARRVDMEAGCRAAAGAAGELLSQGASALDAVESAVRVLEDNPLFNAGTGASLNAEGHLELDASIMDGTDLRAGAVCGLGSIRNPVAVARAVLEDGQHVLYAGAGADAFARNAGFEVTDEADMIVPAARQRWLRARATDTAVSDTVGAVAVDAAGSVAAATSTGGLSGKRPGRVGDSPLIGAGNYADARLGAASATGKGEGIIRVALAISVLLAVVPGRSPSKIAAQKLAEMKVRTGATGGLIVVVPRGLLGWARSTPAMPWAAQWKEGSRSGD